MILSSLFCLITLPHPYSLLPNLLSFSCILYNQKVGKITTLKVLSYQNVTNPVIKHEIKGCLPSRGIEIPPPHAPPPTSLDQ